MKHFTGKIWIGCAFFFLFNICVILFLLFNSHTVSPKDPLIYILVFEVIAFVIALMVAHRMLLRHELRFRSLIEKGNEIIAMLDRNGKILYMSPSIETLLGYPSGDRIGKPAFDHIHPDDAPLLKAKLEELVKTPGASVTAQWRHKHANGSWRWMYGVATNLLNDTSVNAVVHNFRDITHRKIAEEALLRSNERYEYVLRATFDAIWDWDLASDNLYWGDGFETIFGYKTENIKKDSHSWTDMIHPEDRRQVLEKIRLVIDSNENSWLDEYRFLKGNGEYAYVRDKGVVVRNEEGKGIRMIGAMQDISLTKKAEEELKEKNNVLRNLFTYLQNVREEERKKLAREVHDELGQLASALKIDIDWLRIKTGSLEPAAGKRIDHAHKVIEILISTVRKIAADLRPSVLDDFGLTAALQWHCNEFESLHGMHCVFESSANDKEIPAECGVELFRITQELLNNVMLHAKARNVKVRLTETEEYVILHVADDGEGFDTGLQKNNMGLLGLRERAAAMNGELQISSTPGTGTKVSVSIPKIKNQN